jgi:predicted metal-dependent hydrolase
MNKRARKRKRPVRPLDKYAFKQHVRRWAERIGVQAREIHVRTMTANWASCSRTGRVTFSTGLLIEPAAWREYVIVHELLHLQVPNHGKLFKALLTAFLPNWEKTIAAQERRNTHRPGPSRSMNGQ